MQVWNLLHAARWKHGTQKSRQKSPSGHHCTILSGYIFATKAHIDNRKKLVKQLHVLHMSPQYGELRPTGSWDWSGSLRHPCKFQRVSRLGSVTAQHLVVALNRGRHLCSAGRPSRWALAHILVLCMLTDKAAFSKRLNKVDMLNSRDLGRYVNQVCCPVWFIYFTYDVIYLHKDIKAHIQCKPAPCWSRGCK